MYYVEASNTGMDDWERVPNLVERSKEHAGNMLMAYRRQRPEYDARLVDHNQQVIYDYDEKSREASVARKPRG